MLGRHGISREVFDFFFAEKMNTALASTSMYHQLKKFAWKDDKRREGRIHDKEEKAVAEQAVDPQTKILLFKMINNGILENVNGVISTGKEAVILHAEGGPGPDPGVTII